MEEKSTNPGEYRPPEDFNPYNHADAIKGIAECLHDLFTEGRATDIRHSNELRSTIVGLVWAQHKFVQELHEWLMNIENLTTIRLPIRAEDFDEHHVRNQKRDGVEDAPAIYAVK